jgi:archaellum component FlaC
MNKVDEGNYEYLPNPFKPNTSRVDKLENQITNLKERVATLERDLHFFMRHYEKNND